MVTEIPRLPLAYLRELRLELDACLSLLRDDSCREEGDTHEGPPTMSPPIRPIRAQEPTGADGSGRANETILRAPLMVRVARARTKPQSDGQLRQAANRLAVDINKGRRPIADRRPRRHFLGSPLRHRSRARIGAQQHQILGLEMARRHAGDGLAEDV